TVFALGLSVRYATSWSFTPPADPTRQVLNLNPDRAPEFPTSPAVVFRDREQTTWEVAFATGSVVEDLPPRAAGDEQKLQYGLATVTIPEFRPRGSLTLAKDSGQTRTSSSRTDEITRDPARHMSADEF